MAIVGAQMVKRKPKQTARRPSGPDGSPEPGRRRRPRRPAGAPGGAPGGGELWLYGSHAVLAALANPRRRIRRLLITDEAAKRLEQPLAELKAGRDAALPAARAAAHDLAQVLPEGAVHQGLALQVAPLDQPDLDAVIAAAGPRPERPAVVLALDQVTDPQNVGAILRSACAFGVAAVLTTERRAAVESGALVKAASGAFEHLPYVQETNLARSLDRLREADYLAIGLAAEAEMPIYAVARPARLVLVLGAEGAGLRRLTRERCDLLVRLPTQGPIDHLNVSNAAAVSLYELLGTGSRTE